MRRPASFILLLLIAFGMTAGPHPCHAMRAVPEKAHPSCHAQDDGQGSAGGDQVSPGVRDCCKGGNSRLCENACQITAAVLSGLPMTAELPVSPIVLTGFDRSVPLFAHTIDHIPLA